MAKPQTKGKVQRFQSEVFHDDELLLHAEYFHTEMIDFLSKQMTLLLWRRFNPSSEKLVRRRYLTKEFIVPSGSYEVSSRVFSFGETEYADEKSTRKGITAAKWYELWHRLFASHEQAIQSQIEDIAQRAEIYVRENLTEKLREAILELCDEALHKVWGKRSGSDTISRIRSEGASRMKRRLRIEAGRPPGTGLFKNTDDFLTALSDVLKPLKRRPSEKRTLELLRRHPLSKKTNKQYSTSDQTKTLRDWLKRCGMTYDEALERYLPLSKARE